MKNEKYKKNEDIFNLRTEWNNIIEDFQVLQDFLMNWANQISQNSKRNFSRSYGSHIQSIVHEEDHRCLKDKM